MFDAERIEISADKVPLLFDLIKERGFIIKPNNVDWEEQDKIDFSVESFIIFFNSENVIKTVRKSHPAYIYNGTEYIEFRSGSLYVYYEYGSEGIFVHQNRRTKTFSFTLDKRIVPSSKIALLFKEIEDLIIGR